MPVAREPDPERLARIGELRPALGDPRGRLGEVFAAAGPDLDLGGDQLADEVLVERGALRHRLELLEAVVEVERLRVEERELLLDREGEVAPGFELLARERELLVRAEAARRPRGSLTVTSGYSKRSATPRPAPALDRAPARAAPSAARASGASASSSAKLRREVGRVARSRSSRGRASSGGYSASRPAAISASPEWRATSGGQPAAAASAATMPNASGKIDGTTATSQSGSRCTRCRCSSGAGEERARRRQRLELLAVVAEPDDSARASTLAERLEEQVNALVAISLPK